ncbi:uncharacterized protein LOC129720007 [Wyeomyia smithii]|uniref:uncharacterized protein LOC129720007 n=1 Tax=Wyeomyia smithii TaxID=174621 RepID=UPI002467C808|nr:uncharacterized protein LOC129720007 [Wyeomyia smithii]
MTALGDPGSSGKRLGDFVVDFNTQSETARLEYEALQEKILPLISADDRQQHDDSYVQFDELHDEVTINLQDQLAKLKATPPLTDISSSQTPVARPQLPFVIQQPSKMPIPSFDGRYKSWPKFKAMFRDLVDKSSDPPAVKLYHLDKALMGNAAGLIDGKTINEGNYAHAWEILEERYENKRHTMDSHIHGLLSFKRMSEENHLELRGLLDECTRHMEALKFLGQALTEVSELIVVHLLAAALDKDTRRRWESTVIHGDLPNYGKMMKYLKEQCFIFGRDVTTQVQDSNNRSRNHLPPYASSARKPLQ